MVVSAGFSPACGCPSGRPRDSCFPLLAPRIPVGWPGLPVSSDFLTRIPFYTFFFQDTYIENDQYRFLFVNSVLIFQRYRRQG